MRNPLKMRPPRSAISHRRRKFKFSLPAKTSRKFHPVSGERILYRSGTAAALADSGLSPQYVGDRSIAIVAA
jgi:hypothetical protein